MRSPAINPLFHRLRSAAQILRKLQNSLRDEEIHQKLILVDEARQLDRGVRDGFERAEAIRQLAPAAAWAKPVGQFLC